MGGARRVMRQLYQVAAEACAEVVVRVPALEAPLVGIGRRIWSAPGVGRFYRSTAHRIAQRMTSAGTPFRRLSVCGEPLVLDATEFTTLELYFGGLVYEAATTKYLAEHLAPGHVFVDIGANHGYFSMLAAARVGSAGRVMAFEPNPAVFAQLQKHAALNGFESWVTLAQMALSDAPDPAARFFVSQVPTNSGLSSLTPPAETLAGGGLSKAHTIPVRVETFDSWFAASGLDHVDLMKIDVEGAEARVVAGMRATLASGVINALICETVWGSPAHAAIAAAGYQPEMLDPVGSLANVLYSRKAARA
jgi:FkbM family methyltransferase